MNLPNILTLSRIVLAIVLVFLLEQRFVDREYFGGSCFYDRFLNGFLRRPFGQTRGIGQ